MLSTSKLKKLAKKLLKARYIEKSPVLSSDELKQLLALIVLEDDTTKWRLVQHKNVEADNIWYELDLQDGWFENTYKELEWLNYTR